ncbi:hypothetical protein HY408_01990 [Candidatus Gottesmanbacteria bacterium]|nr:hypothetical protein [Candidatus Gottesmanbacteria bacterium]
MGVIERLREIRHRLNTEHGAREDLHGRSIMVFESPTEEREHFETRLKWTEDSYNEIRDTYQGEGEWSHLYPYPEVRLMLAKVKGEMWLNRFARYSHPGVDVMRIGRGVEARASTYRGRRVPHRYITLDELGQWVAEERQLIRTGRENLIKQVTAANEYYTTIGDIFRGEGQYAEVNLEGRRSVAKSLGETWLNTHAPVSHPGIDELQIGEDLVVRSEVYSEHGTHASLTLGGLGQWISAQKTTHRIE